MVTVNPAKRDKSKPCLPLSQEQQVLAHSQSSREIIQDYCPLAASLEWELGQQYFRERGNKAFIGDHARPKGSQLISGVILAEMMAQSKA